MLSSNVGVGYVPPRKTHGDDGSPGPVHNSIAKAHTALTEPMVKKPFDVRYGRLGAS